MVGNLLLTESKYFVPYLSSLSPMVRVVLVKPIPEARATTTKALGTLVERLGKERFPVLVPELLRTLKTDTSGIDRHGAGQDSDLSEVLLGLGTDRLEGLLPDIIANAQSFRRTVRKMFMSLLVQILQNTVTSPDVRTRRVMLADIGHHGEHDQYAPRGHESEIIYMVQTRLSGRQRRKRLISSRRIPGPR
ncbi:hypothetical protein OG21DRAFT_1200156 [Imleria badia]|nr:hypothetical protein OG21DRAFT_1200156 [Imleria badia]